MPIAASRPWFAGLVTCSAPAMAQRLGQGPELSVSLWRVAGALLLCALIALAAILAVRRRGGIVGRAALPSLFGLRAGRDRSRITVVESRRVSPHANVCLLRCDGREYLVLVSEHRFATLSERPCDEDGAAVQVDTTAG